MPFDGIAVRSHSAILADAAADLGISGISETVLARHMAAEAAKHQGDFLYRHQAGVFHVLRVLTLGGGIGALTGLVSLFALSLGVSLVSVSFCLILFSTSLGIVLAPLFILSSLTMRPPAIWRERDTLMAGSITMPAPILQTVTTLKRALQARGVWDGRYVITYGELLQEHVLLDPYVLVQNRATGERLILGIWIDDTVLHIAQ